MHSCAARESAPQRPVWPGRAPTRRALVSSGAPEGEVQDEGTNNDRFTDSETRAGASCRSAPATREAFAARFVITIVRRKTVDLTARGFRGILLCCPVAKITATDLQLELSQKS